MCDMKHCIGLLVIHVPYVRMRCSNWVNVLCLWRFHPNVIFGWVHGQYSWFCVCVGGLRTGGESNLKSSVIVYCTKVDWRRRSFPISQHSWSGRRGDRIESRVLAASASTCAWISLSSLYYPNPLARQHRTGIEKVECVENSSHNCFGVHGQID